MGAAVRSFLLCDDAREQTDPKRFDLVGAPLDFIRSPIPVHASSQIFMQSFWAFLQLYDENREGIGRFALARADLKFRYYFRKIEIQHDDPLRATPFTFHMFDFQFPERGVYYVEFWYNNLWLIDQRLEVI